MIIAMVSNLKFKDNPCTQTVYYNSNCKNLEFSSIDRMKKEGTFKAVMAETYDEATVKLRNIVIEYLESCWISPKLEDFTFGINYTEVNDLGEFWLVPCISVGGNIEVKI